MTATIAVPEAEADLEELLGIPVHIVELPNPALRKTSNGSESPLKGDPDRLSHVLEAASEIAQYVNESDLEGFLGDKMRRRAVERVLTMIGEAAKQLAGETRGAIGQPWCEIIRFRGKGIHGSDALAPRTIFAIATVSVPRLRKAVERDLAHA